MIKERDEFVKKYDINKEKTSIKTARTMKEIENNETKISDIPITSPDKVIFKWNKVTKKDYYVLLFITNKNEHFH